MLEVEMKFPVADLAGLQDRIVQAGGRRRESRLEADQYFNAPDRDFARTDEAFRLRRVGELNFLTYKGPKLDTETKTRKELEVPLVPGSEAAAQYVALLTSLGYRPVAVVHKDRTVFEVPWHGRTITACLDRVQEIGDFVELEIVAPEEEAEAARQAVRGLAAHLGLKDSIRRSYLGLLLERRARSSQEVEG